MVLRRKYIDEFKRRAVRMSYSSKQSVRDVAKSLGIDKSVLYQWRKRYTPDSDKSEQAEQEEENNILKIFRPTSQRINVEYEGCLVCQDEMGQSTG